MIIYFYYKLKTNSYHYEVFIRVCSILYYMIDSRKIILAQDYFRSHKNINSYTSYYHDLKIGGKRQGCNLFNVTTTFLVYFLKLKKNQIEEISKNSFKTT